MRPQRKRQFPTLFGKSSFSNGEVQQQQQQQARQSRHKPSTAFDTAVAAACSPVRPTEGALSFGSDQQRFTNINAADLERTRRQQVEHRKKQVLQQKRQESVQREVARGQEMEAAKRKEDKRIAQKSVTDLKNAAVHGFNIIDLHYDGSQHSGRLREQDDQARRAAVNRCARLFVKSRSKAHNIITGQPLPNLATGLGALDERGVGCSAAQAWHTAEQQISADHVQRLQC